MLILLVHVVEMLKQLQKSNKEAEVISRLFQTRRKLWKQKENNVTQAHFNWTKKIQGNDVSWSLKSKQIFLRQGKRWYPGPENSRESSI